MGHRRDFKAPVDELQATPRAKGLVRSALGSHPATQRHPDGRRVRIAEAYERDICAPSRSGLLDRGGRWRSTDATPDDPGGRRPPARRPTSPGLSTRPRDRRTVACLCRRLVDIGHGRLALGICQIRPCRFNDRSRGPRGPGGRGLGQGRCLKGCFRSRRRGESSLGRVFGRSDGCLGRDPSAPETAAACSAARHSWSMSAVDGSLAPFSSVMVRPSVLGRAAS